MLLRNTLTCFTVIAAIVKILGFDILTPKNLLMDLIKYNTKSLTVITGDLRSIEEDSYKEFLTNYRNLVGKVTSLVRWYPHVDFQLMREYRIALDNVEKMAQMEKQDFVRYQPFGIIISGPPGTGKTNGITRLTTDLYKETYNDYGIDKVVVLNESDSFQSEFQNRHKIVIFDDLGATLVDYGEDPFRKIIDFINNVPKTALKPEVELKGRVWINPFFVGATTNLPIPFDTNKGGNTESVACPAALNRRFKVMLWQTGYDEFRIVDSSKPYKRKGAGFDDFGISEMGGPYSYEELYPIIKDRYMEHHQSQLSYIKHTEETLSKSEPSLGFSPQSGSEEDNHFSLFSWLALPLVNPFSWMVMYQEAVRVHEFQAYAEGNFYFGAILTALKHMSRKLLRHAKERSRFYTRGVLMHQVRKSSANYFLSSVEPISRYSYDVFHLWRNKEDIDAPVIGVLTSWLLRSLKLKQLSSVSYTAVSIAIPVAGSMLAGLVKRRKKEDSGLEAEAFGTYALLDKYLDIDVLLHHCEGFPTHDVVRVIKGGIIVGGQYYGPDVVPQNTYGGYTFSKETIVEYLAYKLPPEQWQLYAKKEKFDSIHRHLRSRNYKLRPLLYAEGMRKRPKKYVSNQGFSPQCGAFIKDYRPKLAISDEWIEIHRELTAKVYRHPAYKVTRKSLNYMSNKISGHDSSVQPNFKEITKINDSNYKGTDTYTAQYCVKPMEQELFRFKYPAYDFRRRIDHFLLGYGRLAPFLSAMGASNVGGFQVLEKFELRNGMPIRGNSVFIYSPMSRIAYVLTQRNSKGCHRSVDHQMVYGLMKYCQVVLLSQDCRKDYDYTTVAPLCCSHFPRMDKDFERMFKSCYISGLFNKKGSKKGYIINFIGRLDISNEYPFRLG